MKKFYFLLLIIALFAVNNTFSQVYTISGKAFLQFKTDQSNIMVILHRTAPSDIKDTVFTDVNGNYSKDIEMGIYQVIFLKQNFYSDTVNDVKLFSNITLNDVTLQSAGLTGNLSGVLTKGDYVVGDSIFVRDGDTLFIEPGTRLFFKKNRPFLVNGILYAIGTEKDSIIFTRFLEQGDNSDTTCWKGITLKCPLTAIRQETSILKYCHISYCNDHAIYVELACPTLQHLLISDFIGYGALETFSCRSKISEIKLANLRNNDTNHYIRYYPCIYLVETISDISNVEITNIISKNMSAVSTFNCGKINLINFFIHDNYCNVMDCFYNNGNINFINSTIVNNLSGIFQGSGVVFSNCIFANDSGFSFGGSRVVSSDIYLTSKELNAQDKWVGVNVIKNKRGDSCDVYGNILLDPQFKDYANHDYSLSSSSPCIDAGVNDSVKVSKDFLGNKRFWDGNNDGDTLVDMGAFEFGAIHGIAKRPIDEDFEYGFTSWSSTNNKNNMIGDWIVKNTPNSHSGKYSIYLPESSDYNSTLTTDEFIIKENDSLKLTFWLSENTVNKVQKNNDLPFYSNKNQLIVNLKYYEKGRPEKIELLNLSNIKSAWTKYQTDISKYASRTYSIEFTGIIKDNAGILLDDILVAEPDNSTEVNDGTSYVFENNSISVSPNPISKFAKVAYNLTNSSNVRVSLFDALGQEVALLDDGLKDAGSHTVNFGISSIQNGVYFLKLQTAKEIQTRKIVVVK